MSKTESSSTKDSDEDDERWIRQQLSESNPSPVKFRRLKPRLGPQYQTRVSKQPVDSFASSRPLPERMSQDNPFLTDQDERKGHKRPLAASVTNAPAPGHCRTQGTDRTHDRIPTKRGGFCIHRRSSIDVASANDFMLFCQGLMRPPQSDDHVFVTEESWKQEMIRHYGTSQQTPRRGSPGVKSTKRGRKGVKRRRPGSDSEEVCEEESETQSTDNDEPVSLMPPLHDTNSQRLATISEDDPAVLEYLHRKHRGNTEVAQLAVLVDLSAGRAVRARKRIRKHLYNERFKQPPIASSQSWRNRFERTFPTMVGDLRDDASEPAIYPHEATEESQSFDGGRQPSGTPPPVLSESLDDMKGVWRSVLSYGQIMERSMGEIGDRSKRQYLSEVLTFVQNAYGLPTPEEAFGSRHIVVEQISLCLHAILDHVSKARDAQAKLTDKLLDQDGEGVDLDALKKYLDGADSVLSVKLDEIKPLGRLLDVSSDWQARLDSIVEVNDSELKPDVATAVDSKGNLKIAEELALEAQGHGIRSRNLVLLEKKIDRAYRLRDRIVEWNESNCKGRKENFKVVAAMVREANRMDLSFPEMSQLLSFHSSVEEWIDRANIAIRSRMALSEIESLIEKGELMPIDLSEFLEKLRSRVRLAHEWIEIFKKEVPCPYFPVSDGGSVAKVDNLAWLARMREALRDVKEGTRSVLLDMASEGSRIPVEIDCVKMLQLEIDAKNWSLKGRKWIPQRCDTGDSMTAKRGKLEDLREHFAKAEALRERLVLPANEQDRWALEGESELTSILDAADKWFGAYKKYLEGDNRRNQARRCISIGKLRQVVAEANQIHANIGNASAKATRILAQAETWYKNHYDLLVRCGLCKLTESDGVSNSRELVLLTEMSAAVADAASDISLDLEEALELGRLASKTEQWFDRASLAAPKRSKRNVRVKASKNRFSLEDLMSLIDDSSELPVDTADDVDRLKIQLSLVQTWRLKAHGELQEIATSFVELRDVVTLAYGAPEEFLDSGSGVVEDSERSSQDVERASHLRSVVSLECREAIDDGACTPEDVSQSDSGSCGSSEQDSGVQRPQSGSGGTSVHKMIEATLKSARSTGIYTVEQNVLEILQKASTWFLRSVRYLDSPNDMYDKRYFNAFNQFIKMGEELVAQSRSEQNASWNTLDADLTEKLNLSWGDLLSDQLVRLSTIQSHRDQFIAWCDNAEEFLSSTEKKIPLESLKKLSDLSASYPEVEMVQSVRDLYRKATAWAESTNEVLNAEDKLSMQDAKDMFDEGDRLNVACTELKRLRHVLRAARSWITRVKRSKLDQGCTHISDVQDLIEEHDSLMISMPEHIEKLQQAMQGYCICRRPYDGFMIGCDDCDEWYHGPCIGVSESQAGRFDKYTCVRCCVKKVFKISSESVVSVVRKWNNPKDLKKSRQTDWQKHQRKVRKEKRDIEKLEPQIEILEQSLRGLRNIVVDSCSTAEEPLAKEMTSEPSLQIQTVSVSAASSCHVVTSKNESMETINSNKCTTDGDVSEGKHSEEVQQGEKPNSESGDVLPPGKIESNDSENKMEEESSSELEIQAKLEKAEASLKNCRERLEILAQTAAAVKVQEKEEDEKSGSLQKWSIIVCLSVIVPAVTQQSRKSLPPGDGSLSAPMLSTLGEARNLGIDHLPDVASVSNSFSCISWSLRAMRILARQPTVAQASSLVSQTSSMRLPEEKSLRMLKSMVQRANAWRAKVSQALSPRAGNVEPCCVDTLKDLVSGAEDIPLKLPEEARLQSAIDDNGVRHCFCGWPSDGEFMLGCDKCDRWFHGRCVNVCKNVGEDLHNWVCPPCKGIEPATNSEAETSHVVGGEDNLVSDVCDFSSDDDVAPSAPNPNELWPPFGLLESQEALEALGKESFDRIKELYDRTNTTLDHGEDKVAEMGGNVTIGQKGDDYIVLGDNTPLVVSPEYRDASNEVDIIPEPGANEVNRQSEGVSDSDNVAVDKISINREPDLSDRANGLTIEASSSSEIIDNRILPMPTPEVDGVVSSIGHETGVVTETSVGSVEESDERNPTSSTNSSNGQRSMEDDENSSAPVAALVSTASAIPGAYLGAAVDG